MTADPAFPPPGHHDDLELGARLTPRFDANGLITAVVTDAATGEVLMLAHMNAEALARTIETGVATFWSRSRQAIWVKGETSGNRQVVREMRVDCDQDAVWLMVDTEGHGAACHRGFRSCFYRRIAVGSAPETPLARAEDAPLFDPEAVYGPNPGGHGHDHRSDD
ncbi:phosphoribosyl-AMP cyclohydrolase [Prosthecomicrobium sp. N25]|uniref:phosphoribosyl-AMP cyclohydrolase n=1 Tax=Prosthecomicrobium sp. N25 TaxID=3129254 RepID=UPI003076A7E1